MSDMKKTRISRRSFLMLAAALGGAMAIDLRKLSALASQIQPKDKFPVVVIGGGLGGLSAGAILARQGFPVTLLERHDKPGGYATAFERNGGRFLFDVSLHATAASSDGPIREIFEAAGVLDKVETVELPELCRIITPDHGITWPQRNPEAIVQQLSELVPAEADGIRGFFDEIMSVLDDAMKPFDRDSWWDTITFPLTHRNMWRLREDTLADILDRHTQDKQLRSILSVFWGYYGLPPSRLSGFLYAIATASYVRFGAHYVLRRSQDLSDALMTSIEAAGGTVMLNTEAEGIEVDKDTVSGVRLVDGRSLPARAVISNANAPDTLEMLPEELRASADSHDYVARLDAEQPSLSTFLVWLGLNREIRGEVSGYEVFLERSGDVEESYQGALACDPERAGIGVTIYDNAYAGYSTPGTSTVALLMLCGYEPWRRFEADYFAGRKEAYREEKNRIADRLIDIAEERVIPGLRDMIEVKVAATPLTNVRYTKNPGGAIYGYEQTVDNTFINRIGTRTPFKGLYLGSAWGSGGGYEPNLRGGLSAYEALIGDFGGES